MVVLRCTRKLPRRLKRIDEGPSATSTTRLGDWYGNTLLLGRRQVLILISERSRLPVLNPIREVHRLPSVLPDAIAEMLAAVGVPLAGIEEERSQMSTLAFDRTRSRSLLGTLNDFSFMAQVSFKTGRLESLEGMARFLARTPILPLGGARPVDLTRRLFAED